DARLARHGKVGFFRACLSLRCASDERCIRTNRIIEKSAIGRQFSKAIEMLGDVAAIPAVLLINGHNPLTLLHDLLSDGIHELNDADCLERAQQAEIILCEMADRMQTALTERKNVKAAITSIMTRKRGTGGTDRA